MVEGDNLYHLQKKVALGDEKAFRQLFNHFASKLTRFAFSITQDKEAALEMMDEVFVKVWKNRSKLPDITNLKTYLYTSIKNASLNYLSQKARVHHNEFFDLDNLPLADHQSPEQMLIAKEIFKKISNAVDSLPPKCRIIFRLVREDGLKYREVAEILNISVKTVDAQMVIAVKKISEKVKFHLDVVPGKKVRSA